MESSTVYASNHWLFNDGRRGYFLGEIVSLFVLAIFLKKIPILIRTCFYMKKTTL